MINVEYVNDKCLLWQNINFFRSKIAKNAVFTLCCQTSIAEVGLRCNLVQKCHSAIAKLGCASTELKSSLQKLCCASKIKNINCTFCAALLLVKNILTLLIQCYLCPPLVSHRKLGVISFNVSKCKRNIGQSALNFNLRNQINTLTSRARLIYWSADIYWPISGPSRYMVSAIYHR